MCLLLSNIYRVRKGKLIPRPLPKTKKMLASRLARPATRLPFFAPSMMDLFDVPAISNRFQAARITETDSHFKVSKYF